MLVTKRSAVTPIEYDGTYHTQGIVHGLFKSICRSGANPEKVFHIRWGAMQVYHHNHWTVQSSI